MDKTKLFMDLVDNAHHIVISTHIMPDADGIGSQVALCLAFRELGKEAICVNADPLMDRYKYLDPKNSICTPEEYKQKYPKKVIDLFIVVDANSPTRIGVESAKLLEHSKRFLFIDHHPAAPAICAIHVIDTTMAATGQLVGNLIKEMNIEFSKEMALALYTSILIDTSSFRYPTVTGDTHRMVAELLDTQVTPHIAYNHIYGTTNINYMHLLGRVLSSAQETPDKKIAWIIVREEDVEAFNCNHEDTHGFVNHLLILEDIELAVMFRNLGGKIKVSLRSHGDLDVSEIALALGGGGHSHSAACVFDGNIDEVVQSTVTQIQMIIDSIA